MHNFFKQPALQQTVVERPATAKPRDPDSYDFKDEQLAKDYRKMYDRYNEMEEMMKAQSIVDGDSDQWNHVARTSLQLIFLSKTT